MFPVILLVSLVFQFIAVYFSLRLIKITGKSLAWGFIALAIVLMALRRSLSLEAAFTIQASTHQYFVEIVALIISILMTIGIGRITPIFKELYQAATRLQESEWRYRVLFDNSPEAILIADLVSGQVIDANQQACLLTGRTQAELLTMSQTQLHPQATVEKLQDFFEQKIRKARLSQQFGPLETLILYADGREIPVEVMAQKVSLKGKEAIQGVFRDISERKLAEQEHREHLHYLSAMERINQVMQKHQDVRGILEAVLEQVLDIFDGDRAYLLYPCNPAIESWAVPIEAYRPEYPGASAQNKQILITAEVAELMHVLLAAEGPVAFGPESAHVLPRDLVEHFQVQSFLAMAIYPQQGEPWQFGLHQCSHARVWTKTEKLLLQAIGMRLSDALTSLHFIQELQASEAKYRRIISTAREGIWVLDAEFKTSFVNARISEILGYSESELLGRPISDFIFTADIPDYEQKRQALQSLQPGLLDSYEQRFRHKQGHAVWSLLSSVPIVNDAGEFSGAFAMFTDITQRKLSEKKLQEALFLLEGVIEQSPLPLVIAQPSGELIFNRACIEHLGVEDEADSIQGLKLQEITPSWQDYDPQGHPVPLMELPLAKVMQGKISKNVELRLVRKDSSERWASVNAAPIYGREGELIAGFVAMLDITAQKQVEEKLKLSESRFRRTLEAAQIGLWDWDVKNDLFFFSPTYYSMLGYAPKAGRGNRQEWLERLHPEDKERVQTQITKVLSQEESHYTYEARLLHADGTYRWQRIIGFGIELDEAQKVSRMLGLRLDIDAQKRAEIELQKYRDHLEETVQERTYELELARDAAEKANQAKSIFLANMSHEIRTPMNAILGFGQLLQEKSKDPQSQNYLQAINSAGESLLHIINDILDLSKIESGKIKLQEEPVELMHLMQEIYDLMRISFEDKNLLLKKSFDFAPSLWLALDRFRLRQVILNLLGNALKFTPQGWVELRVSFVVDDPEADEIRGELKLEVQDTGIGIGLQDQTRIFKAFEQVNALEEKGTGLGLAITHSLVQMMQGQIFLKSRTEPPAQGSCFTILLPHVRQVEAVLEKERPPEIRKASFRPARILVADDVPHNLLLIQAMLESYPFEICAAKNGQEACELAKKHRPDLILLDIKMPVLDGFGVIKLLRSWPETAQVPVIALTAMTLIEEQKRIMNEGFDAFLHKPVKREELLQQLSQFLASTEQALAPKSERLHPLSASERQDLAAVLQSEFMPRWQKIQDSVVLDELESFSQDLQRCLQNCDLKILQSWNQTLGKQIQNFQLAEASETLSKFPELVAQVSDSVSGERL